MRKALLIGICLLTLVGCASTRVNYGSLTSEKFLPKSNIDDLLLSTKDLDKPYKEIGIISVVGGSKHTSYDELNNKMREKASEAGADAVIRIEYGSEAKNVMVPTQYGYGSMGTTIHKPSCKGVAVVFTKS